MNTETSFGSSRNIQQPTQTVQFSDKSSSKNHSPSKTTFIRSRQMSAHQVIAFARGPAAEGEALKIRRPLQRVHGVFRASLLRSTYKLQRGSHGLTFRRRPLPFWSLKAQNAVFETMRFVSTESPIMSICQTRVHLPFSFSVILRTQNAWFAICII